MNRLSIKISLSLLARKKWKYSFSILKKFCSTFSMLNKGSAFSCNSEILQYQQIIQKLVSIPMCLHVSSGAYSRGDYRQCCSRRGSNQRIYGISCWGLHPICHNFALILLKTFIYIRYLPDSFDASL